ncbi:VirB4 family type IV secretion system protein [Vibrio maritimus]|uniref:VirB4 family type IV secretion system protein n=1 Tax=Vibrio maritimus TaxID=990268 RepID=UPI001F2DAA3D|nr:type IV secretion system protein B4 [Vibrio maritimus]
MTALNTVIPTVASINEGVLTDTGDLLGVLSLSGIEPRLNAKQKTAITLLLRHILQRLPFEVTLSQYYLHFDSPPLHFKPRTHPRAALLSTRRAQFLNQERHLNQSELYWAITIPPQVRFNALNRGFLTLCLSAIVDSDKRAQLFQALSYRGCTLLEETALQAQLEALDDTLASIDTGLGFKSLQNHRLSPGDIYNLQRTLIELNPKRLQSVQSAPQRHWDTLLANASVTPIMHQGIHTLKIEGENVVYARIASITGCGHDALPEAAFVSGLNPVMEKGNYLLLSKFSPFSRAQKRQMIADKEQALYRSQLSLMDLVTGQSGGLDVRKKIEANPALNNTMKALEAISNDDDHYGHYSSTLVVFEPSPEALKVSIKRLSNVLENSDFHLLWENVGLLRAYESIFLGARSLPYRQSVLSTTQAAALSLFFRSSKGVPTWMHGLKQEEAVYVFETDDGVPFHFTPFVGEKCLIACVGPTRSGKTFLKLCLASHFFKLSGQYCALDVDAGSEPAARFFADDGAIFRLDSAQTTQGFNPFELCTGEDDDHFSRHITHLILLMLEKNESPELRVLTANEQEELNHAIRLTMSAAPPLNTLSALLGQCGPSLNKKLAQFKRGGKYGNLFDNDVDAIGALDKPFSVYNIQGVKDDKTLSALVNTEVFFRTVRLFEHPDYREKAKFLDVDECQYILAQPGAAEFLIAKARTWFKHGGGMGFWTQSPKHYQDLEEWDVLRSACTTFLFMADGEMDKEAYQSAFPFLNDDDCDVILGLKRNQQAYILQPELGIKTVINLFVEKEQYVIATSTAHEAAVANRIFTSEPDVDKAIDSIIDTLGL